MLTGVETTAHDSTTLARRHRWRVWAALGSLAVLCVTAVSGEVWAGRYQPLDRGHLSNSGAARVEVGVGSNRDVYRLPFAPGQDQVLQFTIANTGRHAVTIDGIPLAEDFLAFGIRAVQPVTLRHHGELGSPTRFPFKLQPDQELALLVTYRLHDCGIEGGQTAIEDFLPVR